MKGDLTLKALEVLARTAYGIGELLLIFSFPYGTPLGKALSRLEKNHAGKEAAIRKLLENHQYRRRLYNLLYRLRKDGLIEELPNKTFHLTSKGKRKFDWLREKAFAALPRPSYYLPEKSREWHIVIFDIPEENRHKRAWLRVVLKTLGFTLLQKSVWIGKVKLPKRFLDDLAKLKLLDYVHIFVISKSGSLEGVVKEL